MNLLEIIEINNAAHKALNKLLSSLGVRPRREVNPSFGSICSGIEAASVAWGGLGWEASWFAEIEPFPCALLAHRYPTTPNLGDMTKIPDMLRTGNIEAPDILCGGTPCQAFSVAGNRQSLDDARGNLTLTFCEIADAIDSRRNKPAIIFWENVPGVLNTKDNAFGCFLARIAGEDSELQPSGKRWTNAGVVFGHKRTVAWRVLDAQYFGLAQRRKRVFVVASAREGFDPAKVLFEFEGLRRDTAPSRGKGRTTATGFENRSPDGRPTVGTLMARDYKGVGNQDLGDGRGLCFEPRSADGVPRIHGDLCPTLNTMGGGQREPCVAYGIVENIINRQDHNGGNGIGSQEELQYTLTTSGVHGVAYGFEPGIAKREGEPNRFVEEMTPTMRSEMGDNQLAVAFHLTQDPISSLEISHAITSGSTKGCATSAVAKQMAVRRLTPRECERLQGFPDDYTKIPYRNKSADNCPDGPRYKALGNSWAVPVVRWIGERIAMGLV